MRERDKGGQYWTAHAKANLTLRDKRGQWWTLLSFLEAQEDDEVDVEVFVGKPERFPVRLIAVRVSAEEAARRRERANKQITPSSQGLPGPCAGQTQAPSEQRPGKPKRKKVSPARLRLADWTIVLTNVPQEVLSGQEVLVVVRCRGPLELLWKLWKAQGKLDTWRSYKPERILTEIYAKLLGLLITHWQTLLGCWQAQSSSLVKAKQVVEWMTPCLALAFVGLVALEVVVEQTIQMLQTGCTIEKRRSRPNTYQLVADPTLIHSLGCCVLDVINPVPYSYLYFLPNFAITAPFSNPTSSTFNSNTPPIYAPDASPPTSTTVNR